MADFVHLRLHTEYSLVDGLVRLGPLMRELASQGLGAVAVTDECNLFALVKFWRAAVAAGIKPLVGADIVLKTDSVALRATVLCMNRAGHLNLSRLLTRAHLEGRHEGVPIVEQEWLEEFQDGLILLLSCAEGELSRLLAGDSQARAAELIASWQSCFADRLYLEVQRVGRDSDEPAVAGAVATALELDLPLVASNGVRYLRAEDYQSHEIRVCIHDGHRLEDAARPRRYTDQQYLKSAAQMSELFADLPSAISNSVEIARRCSLSLELGKNVLPDFPVPEGHTAETFLAQAARAGLEKRLSQSQPAVPVEEYKARLDREIDVINQMGFPGYFLIVYDFIRWARDNDVPVGPGRGSGAGSLVAYSLEITDLDPLEFELLFERFLNPERISMPDFDIDFCIEGRDRVIEYVAERYGRDHVSQIITYGSMAAKAVVRDVGRVLGHSYGFCDRIAKLVPFEVGMTLDKALTGLEGEPLKQALAETPLRKLVGRSETDLARLWREDEEVAELIDEALKLEGISRNAGKHAGGVVIAPQPLTEFTPLFLDPDGHPVTQFDKDDVEAVGLVKFDFLGLKTLTVINNAAKLVNAERESLGEAPVDVRQLKLDDPQVYQTLQDGKLTALFQIESIGMRRLVRQIEPSRFDDIVSLLALFRPGPLQSGMVADFIERRHGRAAIEYPHPSLERILKPTYGIILYQEQVMQIAQVLCGYSLGGADLLRRAMGKKKPEIMARERQTFVAGAADQGVDEALAGEIFDLIEKFAGYGFNKSHSAAYAYVAYQTAWLKTYYPAHFMAATMSADLDHTDKLVPLLEDCRLLEIKVLSPDVNESSHRFTVVDAGTLRYGLGAIKGVGLGHVEAIVEEREAAGKFADLYDFCQRVDLRRVNRRVLEALIKCGAFDQLAVNRASLIGGLESALGAAEQAAAAAEAGQGDMFGGALEARVDDSSLELPELPDWRVEQVLQAEKESLGLYFSAHPMQMYRDELMQFSRNSIDGLISNGAPPSNGRRGGGREVVATGVLWGLRRRGEQRTILTLDDGTGRLSCELNNDRVATWERFLQKENPLIIYGRLGYDEYDAGYRIAPMQMLDIEEARRRHAATLDIAWQGAHGIDELKTLLTRFRRDKAAQVRIRLEASDTSGQLVLPDSWRVEVCSALLRELENLAGAGEFSVRYRRPEFSRQPVSSSAAPRAEAWA